MNRDVFTGNLFRDGLPRGIIYSEVIKLKKGSGYHVSPKDDSPKDDLETL
jgi:hypothetical protein